MFWNMLFRSKKKRTNEWLIGIKKWEEFIVNVNPKKTPKVGTNDAYVEILDK